MSTSFAGMYGNGWNFVSPSVEGRYGRNCIFVSLVSEGRYGKFSIFVSLPNIGLYEIVFPLGSVSIKERFGRAGTFDQ